MIENIEKEGKMEEEELTCQSVRCIRNLTVNSFLILFILLFNMVGFGQFGLG